MMRSPKLFRFTLCLALVLALPGCKTVGGWLGNDGEEARTERLPVEEMYAVAKSNMVEGDYSDARRYYTRLVARFPFGPYTEQSQLELAYVEYKIGKPEDALSTINRFIRTYPRHQHIDYAYYLKAVINFDRNIGVFGRIFRSDPSARDLNAPRTSFNDFNEVLRRYPNSRYAPDARQRLVYLRNELARYELIVGLYYVRREAFVASANRGKYLLENYPQSEYEDDAIALLAVSYTGLGQTALAEDATKVLRQNYPAHPYLTGKWPDNESFLRKLNPFSGEQFD